MAKPDMPAPVGNLASLAPYGAGEATRCHLTAVTFSHTRQFMTKDHEFTRGDVVTLVAVPNDVFTFWLRSSLIRSHNERERAGMRLKFSKGQVRIAAVLNQGRKLGLNVEALRAISETLNRCDQWAAEHGLTANDWSNLTEEQNRMAWSEIDHEEYLSFLRKHRDSEAMGLHKKRIQSDKDNPSDRRIVDALKALNAEPPAVQMISVHLLIGEGIITLQRGSDDGWIVGQASQIDGGLPGEACVMFDLKNILTKIDWSAV